MRPTQAGESGAEMSGEAKTILAVVFIWGFVNWGLSLMVYKALWDRLNELGKQIDEAKQGKP